MTTPTQVEPFASLATMTRFDVPRILINREVVGPFKYQRRRTKDVVMTGDLVDKITELVTLAGWEEELQDLMREKEVESTVENNVTTDDLTESFGQLKLSDKKK